MTLQNPSLTTQRARRGVLFFAFCGLLVARHSTALDIDLVTTDNLGFGQVVATSSAGTVTVAPTGARSTNGGVLPGSPSGVAPASFTVTGESNASYSITLPDLVLLTSGLHTMTLDGFSSAPSGSGTLGLGGSQTVHLGATLHVGASQAQGSYLGTFVVIVSYN